MFALPRVAAVKLLYLHDQRMKKLVFDTIADQKIIRGDTGLTRINEFSPGESTGRDVNIRIIGYDAGALPPSSSVTGVRYFAAAS